jgi:hypothetical protein
MTLYPKRVKSRNRELDLFDWSSRARCPRRQDSATGISVRQPHPLLGRGSPRSPRAGDNLDRAAVLQEKRRQVDRIMALK